jgi:hypothetical protein
MSPGTVPVTHWQAPAAAEVSVHQGGEGTHHQETLQLLAAMLLLRGEQQVVMGPA